MNPDDALCFGSSPLATGVLPVETVVQVDGCSDWLLLLQRLHGQREAERGALSAETQQDVPGPRPHGGVDGAGGASAQRPAPGKTRPLVT